MKRYRSHLGFMLALVWGSSALAANGTHFLALSAAAGGMGGATTGHFVAPSDALLRNGATLGLVRLDPGKFILEIDTHIGRNAVSGTSVTDAQGSSGEVSSTAGLRLIPEIAAVYRPIDRLTLGMGILGYGGGVSDFSGNVQMTRVNSELQLARIPLAITYEPINSLRVSFTPFINIGGLVANHSSNLFNSATTTRSMHYDLAFGWQLGAQYGDPDSIAVGASYTSKFTHDYAATIDLDGFGTGSGTAATPGALDSVSVEEPDVFAIGVAGKPMDKLTLAFDARLVRWGTGLYRQMGWDNVGIFALGAEYELNPQWQLRAGAGWGTKPQTDGRDASSTGGAFNEANIQGHSVFPSSLSLLNNFGLPAQGQTHLCVGATTNVNENIAIDFSTILVLASTTVRTGANTLNATINGQYSFTTTQSQWSMALGARFRL